MAARSTLTGEHLAAYAPNSGPYTPWRGRDRYVRATALTGESGLSNLNSWHRCRSKPAESVTDPGRRTQTSE